MTNPVRVRQIRRHVLEALSMSGNYALEESILFGHVDDLVKPPLSFGERGVTMEFLQKGNFIRNVPDSLDPSLKQWVITELGKNLLASL